MSSKKRSFLLKFSRNASQQIKIPRLLGLAILAVSHLQVMSMIMKSCLYDSKNSTTVIGIVKQIIQGFGIFTLWDITDTSSLPKVVWILSIIYIGICILLILAVIILTVLGAKKTGVSRFFEASSAVIFLHSKVIFFPVHYFLLQIVGAKINSVAINSFLSYFGVVAATLIGLVLNTLVGAFTEIFLFRVTKSKNIFSSKNNTHPRLLFVFKFLAPLIYLLPKSGKGTSVAVAVVSIIYSLALLYSLYSKLPLYNMVMLKSAYQWASLTLGVSIVGLVSAVISNDKTVTDVLFMICPPLIAKMIGTHFDLLFTNILKGRFDSPERAIHFPILLKGYVSNYAGLILVRDSFPEESIYLYNSFDPRLDDSEHQKDSVKQRETKQEFYSRIIDSFMKSQIRHQQSGVFLLYLAQIYMKKLENASKALNLIERVRTIAGSSIPMRNSLESFRAGLQETYFKSLHYSAEDLELANYFSYREDFTSLKEAMQKEIRFQLEFWQELSNDTINIKRTVDFSNQIDSIYIGIRNRWRKKAAEFSKVYPSSLLMYGLYLDAIRGLPSESIPMIQSYSNFNKNNNYKGKMGSLNDATALVVASIEKEKLGVVVDASNTVESLFGLPKEKVLGSKINTLMATFIAQRHDWFMQRYLNTTTKNIHKKIKSYGKTASGELVELDIDLRLYPYLDKGVNMMAHIKQVNAGDRIFIVNPNGTVAESSLKMQKDGEKNGLNFKMLNVLERCSEFSRVNTAFNIIYSGGAAEKELKTKLFEETEMSFVKDRTATEEVLGTKDNQITNNYTQLDTNADQFLKTKPNEDLPLLKSNNENLNVPWLSATLKAKTFMNEGHLKTLTKAKTLVSDEEAKSICDAFETSGILNFDKLKVGDDDEEGKQLLMDVRIEPYAVAGNVYKIVRVMDVRVEEIKKLELEMNSPALMMERISGNDSSPLSQSRTIGLSNEVIPEERSDELPRKETSLEQKITFKQKQVAHDDSEHPVTSTKKRNDTNEQFNFSRKEAEDQQNVDMRQSITGKGASSTKSYSRMDMKLIKTLNDFFGEQKIRTVTKVSIYGVYVIMVAVLALAFINYYFTQNSLKEIDGGVTIVYTASSRLTSALKAWQWSLVIYSRMVGLRPASTLATAIQKTLATESANMQELNNQLKTKINDYGTNEILTEIFGTKIKLYDPTTLDLLTDGPLDSFTANSLLAINNYVMGTWTGTDAQLLTRSEPLTAINNTANNFLVDSESQISAILNGLQQIISNNKSLLLVVLICENLSLFVLCGSLFVVARVVMRTYTRTFQALVRLTNESIAERVFRIKKFQTSLDENIEAKSFVHNLNLYLNFFEENAERKLHKSKAKDKEKEKKRFFSKNYTTRDMALYVGKFVLFSYVFILAISGLFEVLYMESLNSFDTLDAANTQLSISNKLSYQSSLVLSSFYFNAIFINTTNMLIRNQDPAEQVDENLASFGNVNNELLSALLDSSTGSYDPIIQDFLQKNICGYLSSSVKSDCESSTQGGTLGLLGFNLKYYTVSSNYIASFKANSTIENTKATIQSYFNDVTTDITVLDKAYNFLTTYIMSGFEDEVSNLKRLNLTLSLIAVIFIVITTILTQKVTLQTLIILDSSQKKLFRSLTYYMFSQNKAVGFLLKKEFGEEVEGLNRILFGN